MASGYDTTLTASPLICTGRLLDNIPKRGSPMALAFGLRRISTSYSGPCIRVRRSSDNREDDIGFVQTDLDIDALLAFASGFDCYVVRWYDQSPQGRDAYQMDATLQPIIVKNGVLVLDNNENRVTMEFNGSHFNTDWTPQESEMSEGAGILIAGAAGVSGSVQGGTVTEKDVAVVTKPDYPNPYLPEGWDTFYYEGLQVTTSSGENQTIYIQDSTLQHLTIDPAQGKKTIGNYTVLHVSSAGADDFLISRTDDTKQPGTDTWYTTVSTMLSNQEPVYLTILGFSDEAYTLTSISVNSTEYYQATLVDSDGVKPVPPSNSTLNLEILTDRTPVAKHDYGIPVPGGPPSISLDVLSTGQTGTNQYRRGVKAGGRIFGVPYDASTVLEIDHKYSYITTIDIKEAGSGYTQGTGGASDIVVNVVYTVDGTDGERQATIGTITLGSGGSVSSIEVVDEGKYKGTPTITISGGTGDPATAAVAEPVMSRIRTHDISGLTSQTHKWWMGVTDSSGNKAYCIPAKAEKVLKIDASTDTTQISLVGATSEGTTDNKWHEGALGVDGCIYAVPHYSSQVLKIDPSNDSVTKMAETYGTNNDKWSSVAVAYDKIFGIPWNAGTILVIDPTNATTYLRGTTGHTPSLSEGAQRSSRGYHRVPDHSNPLGITAPGNGGTTMQVETTGINLTKCIQSVVVKSANQGSGYSSSPSVKIEYPSGTWYNTYPTAEQPSPFKSTMVETFHPEGYSLGYSITGITLTKSGDGFSSGTGKPNIYIQGGKGTTATARAIVTGGKVVAVIISKPGSGYVNWQTIEIAISGGGGSGAVYKITEEIASNVFVPPSYSDSGGGYLTSTGGYLKPNQSLEQISAGSGYTRTPTVYITGGKGEDATIESDDITYVTDGKIIKIDLPSGWVGGTGYTVESDAQASNADTQQLKVASPTENGVMGQVGGTRAIAKISSVDANGAITGIQLVNCGSGYVSDAKVTVLSGGGRPGSGANPTDTLYATYAQDGRLSGIRTVPGTTYSRYVDRPQITGIDNREPEDGSGASTPGSSTSAYVMLEGYASDLEAKTPYEYWGANGYDKWLGSHVYNPSENQATIFTLPWGNCHRGLQIILPGPESAIGDDICADLLFDNGNSLGNGYGKFSNIVANETGDNVYGVKYNFPYLLKIVCASGNVEYLRTSTNRAINPSGRWLDGVLAYNGCIYCVPANANSLLVIDTKTEAKSETITFTNIRGSQNQKWWGVIRAGTSPADGMIYGIPSDLSVVLELNPGIPLRSKSLPALGTVASLPVGGVANVETGNLIVYPPAPVTNGVRELSVYDVDSGTIHTFEIPGENTTFSEGVFLADGTVAFIPTYNSTDDFTYEGRIGIFDVGKAMTGQSGYFTFSPSGFVTYDKASIYPGRAASRLGTQYNQVVTWVPRDGTTAMMVYNKTNNTLLTDSDLTGGLGTRLQDQVKLASSTLIGTSTQGNEIVSTIPSPFVAIKLKPDDIPGEAMTSILLPNDAILIIPGDGHVDFELFYPDTPNTDRGITPDMVTTKPVTKVPLPDQIRNEHIKSSNVFRFMGAVRVGNLVYCIPYSYPKVLVYDYTTYLITELESDDLLDAYVGGMYWGGVIGNGKIYCIPYNASNVMVIDPSDPFDPISFMDTDLGTAEGKWRNGTLMPNGNIIAASFNARQLLVIDPTAHTVTLEDYPFLDTDEQFGDIMYTNNKVYLIPYDDNAIWSIDYEESPVVTDETDLKLGSGNQKFAKAALAPNGRIYMMPYAVNLVYEFDPETKEVTFADTSFYVNDRYRNPIKYATATLARNGKIYSFARRGDSIIEVTPFQYALSRWQYTQTPRYEEISSVPRQYILKPFTMAYDPKYVLYHTANTFSILDANSYSLNQSYTQVISGPRVDNGVASHFPGLEDTVVSLSSNVMTTVSPFQGGVAGIKSFSGNADMYCSIINSDVRFNMGDDSIELGRLFDSLYPNSSMGVFASYASNTSDTNALYVRDVVINSVPYRYEGQTGSENTFSIGRVEGIKVNEGDFNTPGFRQNFNGQMSELVLFSSDQQGRATALGENSSFFYLDSKDQRLTVLYPEEEE